MIGSFAVQLINALASAGRTLEKHCERGKKVTNPKFSAMWPTTGGLEN